MSEKTADNGNSSRFFMMSFPLARELLERLIMPALLVVATFVFGTLGFVLIGQGEWDFFDCAYMTSITLTTVGYGEVLEQMGQGARLFAMIVMWVGMGVTLYAVSTITAFLVERNLGRILRERRMEKRIAALKDHIIVCGAGKTGYNVIKELYATKHPCVVIDGSTERLQWIQQRFDDLVYLHGDPTEEEVLRKGGISNAAGIVATLNEDGNNLLITVQARYVNPTIKIVARCNENNLADKFSRAGANYIVNPAFIGGMRMASEMIRPHVVTFLDRMLRGQDKAIRVEEVTVGEHSPWVGMPLSKIDMHLHTGLTPVALKQPDEQDFIYNPSGHEPLKAGSVMIVIGNPAQVGKLREFCTGYYCST
jgi:voltage-gated potassium channel